MDPITLATVTSILTVIGSECAKGAASKVGEDIWSRAKGLFGWSSEPTLDKLPVSIAKQMHNDDKLLDSVISLLQAHNVSQAPNDVVGPLVQNLRAVKSIVANKIETVNM